MAKTPSFRLHLLSLLLMFSHVMSYSFSSYQELLTLSHSLTSRVATLRANRGDLQGADRARKLSDNLEREMGLGFYKLAWSVGWDYVKTYAWRDDTESFESSVDGVSNMNELLGALCELNHIDSDADRVAWLRENYKNALRLSKSLFARLLKVFSQPGTLQEIVKTLHKEVMEGDLLMDCLELGADDLKDLIQVFKDIALQYTLPASPPKTEL